MHLISNSLPLYTSFDRCPEIQAKLEGGKFILGRDLQRSGLGNRDPGPALAPFHHHQGRELPAEKETQSRAAQPNQGEPPDRRGLATHTGHGNVPKSGHLILPKTGHYCVPLTPLATSRVWEVSASLFGIIYCPGDVL